MEANNMANSIETALVVDDDALMREFIVETLRRNKIAVTEAKNGLEAKELMEQNEYDMAFLDVKMPGMDGMQLLKIIKSSGIGTLPVIITAFGTVEKAVEAMRCGAYDFLMKPFSPEQVEIIINRTRELVELQAQNAYLKEELGWILPKGKQIVGQSEAIKKLMRDVSQVSASNSTVLITGESGTGKELVAIAIHSLSSRKGGPFIRMNCAAVPDTLMDSELFGHEKGAFTSAVNRRIGRFELAHNGTLLLDEVSEMNIGVQAKLLRVLQEHEFERIGGSHTIQTNARVIATTNRVLKQYVTEGKFREDLYYRLNVVPLHIPPLRERAEDIPLLVKAFAERFACTRDKKADPKDFSPDAMEALKSYSWHGNVRELENLMERICVMENSQVITIDMLPPEIRDGKSMAHSISMAVPETRSDSGEQTDSELRQVSSPETESAMFNIPAIEKITIFKALKATGGNRRRSAELLGISIRTLRNKLNQYKREGEKIEI
jgi:two-component system response regulator AtoC